MKINSITINRTRKAVALCLVVLAVATGSLSLFADDVADHGKIRKHSIAVNDQTKKATETGKNRVNGNNDGHLVKPTKKTAPIIIRAKSNNVFPVKAK